MEQRVQQLELLTSDIRTSLVRIEVKLESIDDHGATKADVSQLESTIIKWFVAITLPVIALVAAISFGAATLLN